MGVAGSYVKIDPEEIKSRIQIQDILLDQGVDFKKGRCRCPIHQGNNPMSFSFNDRTYYCFSCGAKGDLITLTQELYRLDFKDALKYLAQKAGLDVETYPKVEAQDQRIKRNFNWDRYFERSIDDTIVFLERVWTILLRRLDDGLRKGKIDLPRYYRDRQWLEHCLNELNEFSIARNWQKNQMRRKRYEKRRNDRNRQA